MRKRLAVASVACVLVAAPAFAQEVNPTFTGPRVEATLGWDHVAAGSNAQGTGESHRNIDGGVVLGAEGEITGSTAKSDRYDYTQDFGYGRVKAGRDLYAGVRAGILASPTTLLYVKGGYTNAKLNVLAGNTNTSTDTSFKLDGWRVGAGAEHALSSNSYAKIEYRYSNYGSGRVNYSDGGTSGAFDVDTDRHQVVASYGFRF